MTVKHKCSGKTWSDIGHNRIYQCSRNATVERGGKWYCWQHDPIRVKADKKKRQTARLAKMDGLYARRAHNAKLAALVTPELPALLEGLARVIDETGIASDVPSVTDETERAFAFAARIREALALEANDES